MTKKKIEDGTTVLGNLIQRLPVKLDEKAVALAGVRLANKLQQHEEFLTQAAGVKKNLNSQEAAIQGDIDTIAKAIRSGVEEQPVEVEVRADFERGVAEFVRLDTGETVTKRTLSDDERQTQMVLEVKERDEAADKAIADGEAPKIDLTAPEFQPGPEDAPKFIKPKGGADAGG